MTSQEHLNDLAERCEEAMGPDRELDCAILVAIDWRYDDWEEGERTAREMAERHGLSWLVSRSVEGYNSTWRHLPRLTASLDAAMTLVPEGWRMAALCEREPWFCRLETVDFDSVTWGKGSDWITNIVAGQDTTAKAATPALALCAAALRARASQEHTIDSGDSE